jgi:hypothetical protein
MRSMLVSLDEPKTTEQSSDVTVLDPTVTGPKLVLFATPGRQPVALMFVALGTVAPTTVDDVAALEVPAHATKTAHSAAIVVIQGMRPRIGSAIGTASPSHEPIAAWLGPNRFGCRTNILAACAHVMKATSCVTFMTWAAS